MQAGVKPLELKDPRSKMPQRLDSTSPSFETEFAQFLGRKRETAGDVNDAVRDIIEAVRQRGDDALQEFTARFDNVELDQVGIQVSSADMSCAANAVDSETMVALVFAADRIKSHHQRQFPSDDRYVDGAGAELGYRWTAVDSAGLYVPGGKAAYPSSVLMNAIPAKVAGVERIAMVVPTPNGELNPLVLAAASLAGVDEVYRIGGAQAIAALAFGTETVAPVAKIVGPGNAYVAAAKRQVFGTVGIDMVAGPSEVLIIADGDNDPDWIAVDLLAQAEHDEAAQSILITDDAAFAVAVERAVEAQLAQLNRAQIARASWQSYGAIITVADLDDAPALANRIAAEHLEIATPNADALAKRIHNAGAIFLGRHTPEAIGDYVAGSNHVLPTARSARFSSALGVLDFMKRTSILRLDPQSLKALGPAALVLATAEGLDAHCRSVAIRLSDADTE